MKTNNIDKVVKQKLENRTFSPSESAWERLSMQLEEQPKKKKTNWVLYTGIAASILLLLTIAIQVFNTNEEVIIPENELVIDKADKEIINQKIDKLINEIPKEEAIVKEEVNIKKEKSSKTKNKKFDTNSKVAINIPVTKKELENIDEVKSITKTKDELLREASLARTENLKRSSNATIKINADDLLFAVSHTPKEVRAYYAKYNVDRKDALKTIDKELKKSNLTIDAETMLAEVERSIDEDDFQNNFLNTLKRRVTDLATVIASRND